MLSIPRPTWHARQQIARRFGRYAKLEQDRWIRQQWDDLIYPVKGGTARRTIYRTADALFVVSNREYTLITVMPAHYAH